MFPRSSRAGIAVALLAAACSSASGSGGPGMPSGSPRGDGSGPDGSRADAANAQGGAKDVCTTLDYGHTRANEDYFLPFDDDASAFEYSKDFLAYNGMPTGKEVSHDARIVRLLESVYGGFRTVFPRETAGLDTPPRIITVNANGVNAFAGFDERPEVNKAPWIFWVHAETVNSKAPDVQIAGLFAHELAHLILRNLLPETREKIRTHYRVRDGKEQGIIGAVAADDPVVRPPADELRELGTKVGRYSSFGPLPLSALDGTDYDSMLATLIATGAQADPAACATASSNLTRAKNFLSSNVSVHDATLHLTNGQSDELAKLIPPTVDSLKTCYANVKMPLFELMVRNRVATTAPGISTEAASSLIAKALDPTTDEHKSMMARMSTDIERGVDSSDDRPTIERLFQVVDTLHSRIAELESSSSLPIDEIRVFDMEEDADDAAVRILRVLGEDPLANARLYVEMMPNPDACYRQVKSGKVPSYGRFIDPHNSTCWRWFHSSELSKALDACDAAAPVE